MKKGSSCHGGSMAEVVGTWPRVLSVPPQAFSHVCRRLQNGSFGKLIEKSEATSLAKVVQAEGQSPRKRWQATKDVHLWNLTNSSVGSVKRNRWDFTSLPWWRLVQYRWVVVGVGAPLQVRKLENTEVTYLLKSELNWHKKRLTRGA